MRSRLDSKEGEERVGRSNNNGEADQREQHGFPAYCIDKAIENIGKGLGCDTGCSDHSRISC